MTEMFATFDDNGQPTGLVERHVVHRDGLWHRAAHVFVFNSEGELLVQRRASDKDLYPDLLDYSVGEHLTPGESFEEGAARGLMEELGISGASLQAVAGVRQSKFVNTTAGFADCEQQQAFRCEWDGEIRPDPEEVASVQWLAVQEVAQRMRATPALFTPWFVRDLFVLGFADANEPPVHPHAPDVQYFVDAAGLD